MGATSESSCSAGSLAAACSAGAAGCCVGTATALPGTMAATEIIAASSRTARIILVLKLFLEFIATVSVLHSHGCSRHLMCRLTSSPRGYRRAGLASVSVGVQCLCTAAPNLRQLGKSLGDAVASGGNKALPCQYRVDSRNQIRLHVGLRYKSKCALRQTCLHKLRAFMNRQEHYACPGSHLPKPMGRFNSV